MQNHCFIATVVVSPSFGKVGVKLQARLLRNHWNSQVNG